MSDAAPMVRAASAGPAGSGAPRGGFTLVELLAVILIIGLITAIAVPVVIQSLAKARNTAIKAEIDMLHMAIMNYKNEYGSFPPCVPALAPNHLSRIFPRVGNATQQLLIAAQGNDGNGNVDPSCMNNFSIAPKTSLVFWLDGYTSNPASPMVPASSRQKLYDFDVSRKREANGKFDGVYHPSGKPNSPYIYIPSSSYSAFPYNDLTPSIEGAHRVPGSTAYFNPDTFQILSAGPDEEFGTDDDLSNFWPGTRREYLDSL